MHAVLGGDLGDGLLFAQYLADNLSLKAGRMLFSHDSHSIFPPSWWSRFWGPSYILVDTLGLLIAVIVHSASIQDRDGAKLLVEKARQERTLLRMRLVWADGGYAGKLVEWLAATYQWLLTIVKRSDHAQGFVVLPRSFVVNAPLNG